MHSHHGGSHSGHHGHSGHTGSSDACTHAIDHYHQSINNLATHAGHGLDSIFGHNNHYDHSPGQIARDVVNAIGSHGEMTMGCGTTPATIQCPHSEMGGGFYFIFGFGEWSNSQQQASARLL